MTVRLATTYIQQLSVNRGCSLVDLPEAMDEIGISVLMAGLDDDDDGDCWKVRNLEAMASIS